MMAPVPGTRGARRRRASSLPVLVVVAALAPLLALGSPGDLPAADRMKGAELWLLCLAPALVYTLRRPSRREATPIFPLIGLTFGLYYALPVILGAVNLSYRPDQFRIPYLDPTHGFSQAIDLALWGWGFSLLGYVIIALVYHPRPVREAPWPVGSLVPWLIRLAIVGLLAELMQVTLPLPTPIMSAMGFAALLSRFSIATLIAIRVSRGLTRPQQLFLFVAIPTELLLATSTGSIAKVFFEVLLFLVAQYMAGGRVRVHWFIAGAAVAVAMIALKGVLQEYRRQAWFSGVELSVTERAGLMTTLVSDQVRTYGVVGAVEHGWEAAVSRSATLDLLADITARTPAEVPYWEGQTYMTLVGFAVPRVLWPSKPMKRLGQDFGHRYGYLDPSDLSTSVNVPFLIEFYMNFGEWGVFLGMLITGMLYRLIDSTLNRSGQSLPRALANFTILLALLSIESDFSLVFGGLFLNAIAFQIVLRFLRSRMPAPAGRAASPIGGLPARLALGAPPAQGRS